MHAAEDRHQQGVAGVLPAQVVGVGTAQHERQQRAGVADDAAHDDEGLEFQAEGAVAEAAHALFVVAERGEDAAERGVRDAPQQPHGRGDGDQREDVKRFVADQPGAGDALHAVLAAGKVGPFERYFEGDLREGEGEQREIQAAAPQDDERDGGGEDEGEDDGEDKGFGLIGQEVAHRDGDGVAGAAEEHRGAERDQAGVADEQVNPGAVEGVDGDLGDQRDRRANGLPCQRERDEDREQDGDGVAERCGHGGAVTVARWPQSSWPARAGPSSWPAQVGPSSWPVRAGPRLAGRPAIHDFHALHDGKSWMAGLRRP